MGLDFSLPFLKFNLNHEKTILMVNNLGHAFNLEVIIGCITAKYSND